MMSWAKECLANPNANDYYRIPAAMNGQTEQPLTPTSSPQPITSSQSITTAPKHWHGSFGDRYEHHNVWVRGGQPQYYPARRSSSFSSSSTASNSSDSPSMPDQGVRSFPSFSSVPILDKPQSPNQETKLTKKKNTSKTPPLNNAQANTSPPGIGDRRQSSSASLFSGLSTQKRNPLDTNMAARRESWKEQVQPGGFFSKWWEGYTKGS